MQRVTCTVCTEIFLEIVFNQHWKTFGKWAFTAKFENKNQEFKESLIKRDVFNTLF